MLFLSVLWNNHNLGDVKYVLPTPKHILRHQNQNFKILVYLGNIPLYWQLGIKDPSFFLWEPRSKIPESLETPKAPFHYQVGTISHMLPTLRDIQGVQISETFRLSITRTTTTTTTTTHDNITSHLHHERRKSGRSQSRFRSLSSLAAKRGGTALNILPEIWIHASFIRK